MSWRIIPILLALLAPCQVFAEASRALPPGGQLCRQAIAAAERAHGIPTHLLAAIARVESGRRDQASGTLNPWPWTTNIDGAGAFYDTKAQAVTASEAIRFKVARSIDVGCMQISLTYHPDAFASMDQAFDPASNADYGARFLLQLFEKTGSWPRAVELYHSATPDLGRDYQIKVYAGMPEEEKVMVASQPGFQTGFQPGSLARAWSATLSQPIPSMPLRQTAARVILLGSGSASGSPAGRSLDSYRSAPVRITMRMP